MMPTKSVRVPSGVRENKLGEKGMKWSFAAGSNLLSGLTAKVDRESKQKLNAFAKELRSFRSVDMSGMFLLVFELLEDEFHCELVHVIHPLRL